MFISTAYAQEQAAGAAGGGLLEMFLPLILIFAIFYFLLIRPQQKRQKAHQAKLAAARRGDKVVLGGGMLGTVTKVQDENEIVVKIAENVEVKVLKHTLMDVVSKTEPAKDAPPQPANESGEEKKSLIGTLFGKKK
ncbi:MAG: preprotein translocase subunit YajC [Alphaproteobacteria bacterium]|jgi:preprotein translocase subunit YajC|nr:preprotein translocase subunit YajC [Alphaproteobacteria bacterium]MBO6864685.1 preprotein translocase subunit YajC [Alphaproteobacteria bacterium]MEC9267790.1 preprotein translocase subunit YajC [Pseudomonadota bacterium]